jgi:hypothetical protein
MSKLPNEAGDYEFRDSIIQPYDWRTVAVGSPLKSSDGMLLRREDEVMLWPGGDVPRVLTAHGVHRDLTGASNRNLYSVQSLAPLAFIGFVSAPARELEELARSFQAAPDVQLGKARSVRGQGELVLERVDPARTFASWGPNDGCLVLQSPVELPEGAGRSQDLRSLAETLCTQAGLGALRHVEASAGIRFGWNRHGLGATDSQSNRLRATRVLLPGSVIALKGPVDDLLGALVRGLGAGRDRGFGAWLPHPGIASHRFARKVQAVELGGHKTGAKQALALWRSARVGGPSVSQIGRLAALAEQGSAAHWLEQQKQQSRPRIWERWRGVYDLLHPLLKSQDPTHQRSVLRTWQDLAIAQDIEREERP